MLYYNDVVTGGNLTMTRHLYGKSLDDSGKGLEKFLGELELAVMEVVWQYAPVSVADVLSHLNTEERSWAYTTIMTIMSRLADKGWLKAEKQGRALIYTAANSRTEAEAKMAGEIVRSLLRDFGDVAVAQFVQEMDQLDPEQLARLADLGSKEDAKNEDEA
jgi:predicted transcriptional regulator